MKIAIADSDAVAGDVLAFAAQRRGHQSISVGSVAELLGRLPFEPNVVVLGGVIGEQAGDLTARLKTAFPDVALMVTLEQPQEPLPSILLSSGVSEVIRTPYNPTELVVRAENIIASRRSDGAVDDVLRMADLELALERYTAVKNGVRLNLTKLELRLLYCLCEHSPHLTPTERLLTFGWDTLGDPDAALIKTHISHIRKKLRDAGGVEFEILSRQTLGYTLLTPDRA